MRIIIPKNENSPSILVKWILDDGEILKYKDFEYSLFIMLSATYVDAEREESDFSRRERKLVPIDNYQSYLDLHYSGLVKIEAAIVYYSCDSLSKSSLKYLKTKLVYDQVVTPLQVTGYGNIRIDVISEPCFVDINPNLFGRPLNNFEKYFIDRYFDFERPQDECAQRRQLFVFYLFKFPVISIEFLIREIYYICAYIGKLLVFCIPNGNNVLHPFNPTDEGFNQLPPLKKFFNYLDNRYKDSDSYVTAIAEAFTILISPLNLLIMNGLGEIFNIILEHFKRQHTTFTAVLVVELVLFIVIFCWSKFSLTHKLNELIDKILRKISDKKQKMSIVKLGDTEIQQVPAFLDNDEKSIIQIYDDLKHKLCRPLRKNH